MMSTPKDPQNIRNLLSDFGDNCLRKIVRHAQRFQSADKIVKQFLPVKLHAHCQVAYLDPSQLTLAVDSAAWLTHLRYAQQTLLRQLKQQPQFVNLQTIQLRILPLPPSSPVKIPATIVPPQPLSVSTKELIKSSADSVTHPELKKALLKLIE